MRGRASTRRAGGGADLSEQASGGMRLGRVVAVNDEDGILVEYPGCAGPTLARVAVAASRDRLQRAIDHREVAVLGFEAGDAFRPLVLALLPLPAEGPTAAPVGRSAAAPKAKASAAPKAKPPEALTVDVDGRRVRIEGHDEIVLQCGKASVTLRRNGKIVLRGTYVETFSEGTNRIKGGQVQIN